MATGNRREDKVVTALTLDKEARAILDQEATGKVKGAFVSRLLYEHRARTEERRRLSEDPERETAQVG